MSDYMFMLESHLSADQNRVLEQVQAAAASAGFNLFLTGGGMRDMLGGFRVRDLDFTVEGNALKVAQTLLEHGATMISSDENRRICEMVFPGGVTAQIAMSRKERPVKTGAKAVVTPASIQDDLRGRDFTVNAMALSLNRASRGLLLDPTNGLADLGHRELRAAHPYAFYDDPVRLLRLIRLRFRLGFTVEPRTQGQYANAREAQVETLISPQSLGQELHQIALEENASEIVQALDAEKLLTLFSPALAGKKLNIPAIARLEKSERQVEAAGLTVTKFPLFLQALVSSLSPKEIAELSKRLELGKSDLDAMRGFEAQAHKLEQALKSARIRKPSHVYHILIDTPPALIVYLLAHSTQRVVQDRIRNYLQKSLPLVQEITPADWQAIDGQPGTPKYLRNRQAFVAARLDARPKKVLEPEVAVLANPAEPMRDRVK